MKGREGKMRWIEGRQGLVVDLGALVDKGSCCQEGLIRLLRIVGLGLNAAYEKHWCSNSTAVLLLDASTP